MRICTFLTPGRVANLVRLYSSYCWSRLTGKPVHRGMPASISVEPTTACNLRCPECPSGLRQFSRPQGNMRLDDFKTIMDQLSPKLLYLNLYFQGEPFLNPELLKMVEYAVDRHIYTCTSTNGHFMDEDMARKTLQSGLHRLVVSVDGATQEVYEQYRRQGKLEKVMRGIEELIRQRSSLGSKTPRVILQCLVTAGNEKQLDEIKRCGEELGVDEVKFKTLQVYNYEKGNPLLPSEQGLSRYVQTGAGQYKIANNLGNHCWRMWSSCVLSWDGMVVPCCFDKDARYGMGHVLQSDFRKIWKSDSYRAFRKSVLTSRKSVDICRNCSEGSKIWT